MQSVDEYNIFREFVLCCHITVLDINDITLILSIQHKTSLLCEKVVDNENGNHIENETLKLLMIKSVTRFYN